VTTGVWNHVAATWDGATIRFYINGVAAGIASASGTLSTYTTPVDLGTYENLRGSGSSYFWGGTLDEVAVYATALSAARISSHYSAATSAPACSDIAGATAAAYVPVAGDVGSGLKVRVSAINGDGTTNATSDATGSVAASTPPANTVLPAITGVAQQAQPLGASTGTWDNSPTSYGYQWQSCAQTGYSSSVLADAPVAYWRLNESTTGAAVLDATTNGNNGTYAGGVTLGVTSVPVLEPDTAATFNGSTGYVKVPSSSSLNSPSTAISLEAWVKPSAAYSEPIVLKSFTSHVDPYYQYGLFENGSGIRMDLTLNGSRISANSSGATLTVGAWNHVVATWDGSTIRFYVNGAAAGSTAASGTLSTYATPVDLATYENLRTSGSSYFWGGDLDEVAVYAKALSAVQVNSHYAAATSTSSACANIAGATGSSYTPVAGDVGQTLRVRVTATNDDGPTSAYSAQTAAVSGLQPPQNSDLPVVVGQTTVGQTLTAGSGTWTSAPTSYTYQWRRCDSAGASCQDISGATASTYSLQPADAAATIRLVVTASNAAGATASTSAPTALVDSGVPVATQSPTVSGTDTQSWTLTANDGTWTNSPTITRQWQRCDSSGANCTGISDATDPTYTLTNADAGMTIRVVVTASNARGVATATPSATPAVTPLTVVLDPSATSLDVALPYNGQFISAVKWEMASDGSKELWYQRRRTAGWVDSQFFDCVPTNVWPNNACGSDLVTYDGGYGFFYSFAKEIFDDFGPNAYGPGTVVNGSCDTPCYRRVAGLPLGMAPDPPTGETAEPPCAAQVAADQPAAFYRLDESAGATIAADTSGNGRDGTYSGSPELGVAGGIVTDPDTSALMTSGSSFTAAPHIVGGAFSVELSVDTAAAGATVASGQTVDGTAWSVGIGSNGVATAEFHTGTAHGTVAGPTTDLTDGAWHEVVVNVDGANSTLYVDGAVGVAAVVTDADCSTLNNCPAPANNDSLLGGNFDGSLDDVAMYDHTLTGSQIATLEELCAAPADPADSQPAEVSGAPVDAPEPDPVATDDGTGDRALESATSLPKVTVTSNATMFKFRNGDGTWTISKHCYDSSAVGNLAVGPGYISKLVTSDGITLVDDFQAGKYEANPATKTQRDPGFINDGKYGGLGDFGLHYARGKPGKTPAGDDPTTPNVTETGVGRWPNKAIEGRMCANKNGGVGVYSVQFTGVQDVPSLFGKTMTFTVWMKDSVGATGYGPGKNALIRVRYHYLFMPSTVKVWTAVTTYAKDTSTTPFVKEPKFAAVLGNGGAFTQMGVYSTSPTPISHVTRGAPEGSVGLGTSHIEDPIRLRVRWDRGDGGTCGSPDHCFSAVAESYPVATGAHDVQPYGSPLPWENTGSARWGLDGWAIDASAPGTRNAYPRDTMQEQISSCGVQPEPASAADRSVLSQQATPGMQIHRRWELGGFRADQTQPYTHSFTFFHGWEDGAGPEDCEPLQVAFPPQNKTYGVFMSYSVDAGWAVK
jgi:hypothetical protein